MGNLQDPFILSIDEDGQIYDCRSYYRVLKVNELLALKMAIDKTYNFYLDNKYDDIYIDDLNTDSHEVYSRYANEYVKNYKKDEKNYNGFIYLMLDRINGYIKIGYSKNPEYREKTLQSELPDIEMIFQSKGTMKIEKLLHKSFNHKRIRGEWFNLDSSDIDAIRTYILENGTSL